MVTATTLDFMNWTWADIEPRYRELEARPLTTETVDGFLRDWSALSDRVSEQGQRLHVAADANTADPAAGARNEAYVHGIAPPVDQAEQRLTRRLLDSELQPEGMEVPLRRMRVDAELFREENLPLLAREKDLVQGFFTITGAQTVQWDGAETPIGRLRTVYEEQDRDRREAAWRLRFKRQMQDWPALNETWRNVLTVRRQIAANAGFADYRAYRWRFLKRFDYTPEDVEEFYRSIETVVVPVVARLYEQRRQQLGVESLRPWDIAVDVHGHPPVRPYADTNELIEKCSAIFHQLDPTLGGYWDTMRREGLLDLEPRANKAPVPYCTAFRASKRSYIHTLAAGTRSDVETLLHESGHVFHNFEMSRLPYFQQRGVDTPMEFLETASMSMELLAEPYLTADKGGFYTREEAAAARLDHLVERVLVRWCLVATIDSVQHWAYLHPDEAAEPDRMSAVYAEQARRFQPMVDWSGLETEMAGTWHEVPHIFGYPFYAVEYAFAQFGAIGIWANAERDEPEAVRLYRQALALGNTRTLPELFAAAGARFAFHEETLREAVALIERTIEELQMSMSDTELRDNRS